MTTASRSSNGHQAEGFLPLESIRRLRSGAPAHEFTTEDRRRGAQRTNEIRRHKAARRRELADYGEAVDKLLLLDLVDRLRQELRCSDCRIALAAAELILRYVLGRPRAAGEPGLLAPALTLAARIGQLEVGERPDERLVERVRERYAPLER